jgi:exocyst complex protein 7
MKRLMTYQPMVESILNMIGDGNWNNPDSVAQNRRSQAASRGGRSIILQRYFGMTEETFKKSLYAIHAPLSNNMLFALSSI